MSNLLRISPEILTTIILRVQYFPSGFPKNQTELPDEVGGGLKVGEEVGALSHFHL